MLLGLLPVSCFKEKEMRTQRQDEVKVAVYAESMRAEQGSQDTWLAVAMIVSALAVAGLHYFA